MTSAGKFGETTKQEKEELTDDGWKKMMLEMREKNQKILERYAEVENDKKTAERQNSSVTTCTKRKEKNTSSYSQEGKQITREWDRDKEIYNMDQDDDRNSRRPYKSFRDTSHQWNVSKDRTRDQRGTDRSYNKNDRSHYYRDHATDRRKEDNWRHRPSEKGYQSSFRAQTSPKRTRGIGYRYDSHKKYADEKYKKYDNRQSSSGKKYSSRGYSRSSSKSMSDYIDNQCTLRTFNLWQNDKSCDNETKHHSIVKWVTSVNMYTDDKGHDIKHERSKFSAVQKVANVNRSYMYSDKKSSNFKQDNTKEVSSVQEEKSKKPYNKFDRIKFKSFSDKSSDEEENDTTYGISDKKKFLDNSKNASQPIDSKQSTNQNTNSMPVKQRVDFERKGVQTKRGLTFNSSSSSLKDIDSNCRKQRKFNPNESRKIDYKTKHKTFKPSSAVYGPWRKTDHEKEGNKNASLNPNPSSVVYGPWRETDHVIEDNKTASLNPNSELNTADARHEDDGIWGDADQSDIRWNLSDQEKGFQGAKTVKKLNKDIDVNNSSKDNDSTQRESSKRSKKDEKKKDVKRDTFDENLNKKNIIIDDDGTWGNVDQSAVQWNLDLNPRDSNVKSAEKASQGHGRKVSSGAKEKYENSGGDITNDGMWGDVDQSDIQWKLDLNPSDSNIKCVVEPSQVDEKKHSSGAKEKFESIGQYITSVNNAYQAEYHSGSASAVQLKSRDNSIENVTNSFQKSVCISDEKSNNFSSDNVSEQPMLSDDGEWSTLSEEGEIH